MNTMGIKRALVRNTGFILSLMLFASILPSPAAAVDETPSIYCWCKLPDTGTCENHRLNDAPAGSRLALLCSGGVAGTGPTDTTSCSDYCRYRGFRAVHCETEYRDYNTRDTTADEENRCNPTTPSESGTPGPGPESGEPTTGGPIRLFNPLGTDVTIPQFIGRGVRAIVGVIGAVALLMFVYGGIMWMTAGSSDRVETAKNIIKNSVIGILLIFFSYSIISIFFDLFT